MAANRCVADTSGPSASESEQCEELPALTPLGIVFLVISISELVAIVVFIQKIYNLRKQSSAGVTQPEAPVEPTPVAGA